MIRTRLAVLASALMLAALFADSASAEPSSIKRWYGDASSATGNALGTGQCDVDGDGLDDVVVGAWFWDKAPLNNVGAAYVLLGDRAIAGGDLNTPAAAGAVRIDGYEDGGTAGFSVGCVGDVNGDGFDDLGIGDYQAEKAFIVLGAEDFGPVDLALLGDQGYEIRGSTEPAYDYNVGFSMGAAGDINDDGLDDIAIAGVVADTQGRNNNGRVWIVKGQEDVGNVDLIADAAGDVLIRIDGAQAEARLGAVAPAGDVNNDGVDDLLLGAYTATPHGSSVAVPGQAWVVWGGNNADLDLAALGNRGFTILGPTRQRDRLGVSVTAVGDVDSDGFDDVAVGGDGVSNAATGERDGSVWVVHGRNTSDTVYTDPAGTPTVYDCVDDDADATCDVDEKSARGYTIVGADTEAGTASESAGYSVAGIGDIDEDGIGDLAIGSYGYDAVNPENTAATMTGSGAVFVLRGRSGTETQSLAALGADDGYRIDGLAAGDRFGRQVAAVGDLDGNGVPDFVGSGDFAQRPRPPATPRAQAGEVLAGLLGDLNADIALTTDAPAELEPGQTFGLEANVRIPALPGPGTGSVTFEIDGQAIAGCTSVAVDESGVALCPEQSLPSYGPHELSASYEGGLREQDGSTQEPIEVLVNEDSITSLGIDPVTVETNDPVALEADIAAATSSEPAGGGTVSFRTAGGAIAGCEAVAVVEGSAECTTAFASAGEKQVSAVFSGQAGLAGSESELAVVNVTDPVDPPDPELGTIAFEQSAKPGADPVRVATVTCAEACAVEKVINRLRIGGASYNARLRGPEALAAGGTAKVSLKLGKKARKALRKSGEGKLGLGVAIEAGDESIEAKRRVLLGTDG